VVVGANALATLGMIAYPPICQLFGFDDRITGVMLGATIHDVAQVVGAGYAISDTAGDVAAITKLFRVSLLLPVVLGIGAYFTLLGSVGEKARMPAPLFAAAFLALCMLNSAMPLMPAALPIYAPVKDALVVVSTVGLLLAISALGLSTSLAAVIGLGWRHLGTLLGSSAILVLFVTVALYSTQH
jgi:uncharacterized membrane protein YadS